MVVNKGFPTFGLSQAGAHVMTLKNYNLPDFILEMIVKECGSGLLEKGRIIDRLQSMNDDALNMLYDIYVECKDDPEGRFAQYRFYTYISSMFHKCEIMVDEAIPGRSGADHNVQVAVKQHGMYIAVASNKTKGAPVSRNDTAKFYDTVDDIKGGEHGTQLAEAIYGSSVGFRSDALRELRRLIKARSKDAEDAIEFKTANFENSIYAVTKC